MDFRSLLAERDISKEFVFRRCFMLTKVHYLTSLRPLLPLTYSFVFLVMCVGGVIIAKSHDWIDLEIVQSDWTNIIVI